MRALVLALLVLSLPAAAGSHLDKFDAKAELVQVSGVGEVPLYRIGDDPTLFVRAKVSKDREALFAVSLSATDYRISEELAKELKLEVKSKNKVPLNLHGEDGKFKEGGEIKLTTLPSLDLGTLHVEGLQVTVDAKLGKVAGYPVEGVIGLAPFESQLAWSIQRSKGVLKVGPSAAGAELVSGLGGQSVAYVSLPRQKYENKVRGYEVETTTQPAPFVVPATVGGQSVQAALDTYGSDCSVSPALELPGAPRRGSGDKDLAWLGASVGGVNGASAWLNRDGRYALQLGPDLGYQAKLCKDVTRAYDLAIDPVSRKLGLAAAGADGRPDLSETLYAEAVARTAPKPAAAEGDAKEKDGAGASTKPDPKPWKALHAVQMEKADYAGALASATKLTEIDARDCSGWVALADAQAASGQFSAALGSYQKASELWHAWWDLPVAQRKELKKALGKLKTDEEKEKAEHREQAAGCFTADGDLALMALATGDHATVQRLYAERLDLDPDVALAAGNAALRQGRWADAQGPYRQAIKRETLGKPNLAPRLGLALANLRAVDWTAAEPAFLSAFERGGLSLLELSAWLDGLRAAKGQEAALLAAKGMASGRPDLLAPQVAWYAEAARAADADAMAAAAAAVEAARATAPSSAETALTRAALLGWYQLAAGKPEEARASAEATLAKDPSQALAWLVLAKVAEQGGDAAKAAEHRAKALGFGASSPGFALLASGQ